MSYTDTSLPVQAIRGQGAANAIRILFVATICTSAFLLFLIQPMYSKMVIPLVGGAPGVWTTAMLFFQSILLAGYAYAHWLASSFTVSVQRQIHLVVTAVAVLALPLAVPTGWTLPDDGSVTPWLLGLFAVSIGAPFFALSANSPLLQEWYAKSGNEDGADPYFLYAASNIGSFGALLAYPLLIEPSVGLANQGVLWSVGYVLLMFGLAGSALVARDAPVRKADVAETVEKEAVAPVAGKTILFWMLLSFVPSSMMLSVTAKIATDFGSFPLIWVTTLGLYLLTYVFAFSGAFRARAAWLPQAQMLASIGMLLFIASDKETAQQGFEIVLVLGFLFLTALAFHTRLAESRPDKAHLTKFFLCMSAGGALGGVFNSILAPMLFDNVHEFTIAVALAFAAGPVGVVMWKRDLGLALAGGAAMLTVALASRSEALVGLSPDLASLLPGLAAGGIAVVLLRWSGHPLRQTALAGFSLAALTGAVAEPDLVMRERSFFGVYEVRDLPEQNVRYIKHGTTMHGMMRTDTPTPEPVAYYAKPTPFGQYFDMLEPGAEVGIVGLGSGGLACHRTEDVTKVFYEIDPLVDRIARHPTHFRFLEACAPDAPTIIGDARLELAEMPTATHDHLMLDAFSSDAVPVHLLTREAFVTYDRVLKDGGTLFVHISNRHFDLEGPLALVAESMGFTTFVQDYEPSEETMEREKATAVRAVVATRNPETIAQLETDTRWRVAQAWDEPIWTDDYADTLAALH